MITAALLYPAPGEMAGRHLVRFDPRQAVSRLKRSIDSLLRLFARHTAAINWNVPKSLLSAYYVWTLVSLQTVLQITPVY